jgi:hypothetical protein
MGRSRKSYSEIVPYLVLPLSDHFSNPVLPEDAENPRLDATYKG